MMAKLKLLLVFTLAAIFGGLLGIGYLHVSGIYGWEHPPDRPKIPHHALYRDWLQNKKIMQATNQDNTDQFHGIQESAYLLQKVRVLCWVTYSASSSHHSYFYSYYDTDVTYERVIMDTWGKRCEKLLFFTVTKGLILHGENIVLDTYHINSWKTSIAAIKYIQAHYIDKYDWFLKVEEDTYIIMENLVYYLTVFNSSLPYYLGHVFAYGNGHLYNTAGAGVVLSRGAMLLITSELKKGYCHPTLQYDDVSMASCFERLGIRADDTRDFLFRDRFLMYPPSVHIIPENIPFYDPYLTRSYFKVREGPECCSDYAITFHYVPPNMMYIMEYMIYHLKPYGITSKLVLPASQSAAVKGESSQSAAVKGATSQSAAVKTNRSAKKSNQKISAVKGESSQSAAVKGESSQSAAAMKTNRSAKTSNQKISADGIQRVKLKSKRTN